ncbi:MAG TPA: helix-turn-helix domain-containing protein [Gammaproteobacteria bacterium]|nr:helix-turn-helix domain-containing protein [Gammaproteobacteria bacterium]HQY22285.1 helix-turn-helix domain-containing protein [Gammaproteobacteria bacterium]HRA42283.1 helix-turn-helix domain-containing protein [Gammaproteobacteria bacterium]
MNKSKPSKPFLREHITSALQDYFSKLEDEPARNIYSLVLNEVESALLAIVMKEVKGNQSRAAEWLGLNRGTLRKLLVKYDLS